MVLLGGTSCGISTFSLYGMYVVPWGSYDASLVIVVVQSLSRKGGLKTLQCEPEDCVWLSGFIL